MTPARDTPVIGLSRVSTEEQEASGAGLDAQEAAIRAACEAKGWRLLGIERETASGKTLAKRPQLRAVLEQLEDKSNPDRPRALVVAKLDRLARSMIDYATLLERSKKQGWTLVVLDPNIDFSTPEGEVMGNMLMTFAQYERRMIGKRTKEGLAQKRREGVVLGRPRAMPAETLAILRELRAEGLSYRRIADVLNERGVRGPQGGRWWDRTVRLALIKYGEKEVVT